MDTRTAAAEAQRAPLLWRCRRGMRELDLLLSAWLRSGFEQAGGEERAAFAALLELPDPQLAAWLLGAERPADPALATLIEAIRGTAAEGRGQPPIHGPGAGP